jgi:hypothetical protein
MQGFNKKHVYDRLNYMRGLIARLHLDDLSKLYDEVPRLQSAASELMEWYSLPDSIYEEVEALKEAFDEAQYEIQSMIDQGMADDGFEDDVYKEMEDHLLPNMEDSIDEVERAVRSWRKGDD